MKVTVELNTSKYLKLLDNINKKLDNTSERALQRMGQELLKKSKLEVPIDTGKLKSSGKVKSSKKDEVTVGYYTKYAAIIHEKKSLNLKNGKEKYLEDPLKNNLSLWQKIFAEELGKIL